MSFTNPHDTGRVWLDISGCFLFGKYKGESAEYVTQDDPSYVAWVVRHPGVDICDEDREILAAHLARQER